MSVNKLLLRVVQPGSNVSVKSTGKFHADMHNYTYGITSDPLTQFGVIFAALIHDVDHWGVSNAQLICEGAPIAAKYKNKSVAEQNSLDLSFNLLLDSGKLYPLIE
jgi:3'5'-cyclic nucleotide phosphodiesterase